MQNSSENFSCNIELSEAPISDLVANIEYKVSYHEVMLDSIFVLCPAGNSPETFRHYEAMEQGAIPIFIKAENSFDFVAKLWIGYPGPVFDSWQSALEFINTKSTDLKEVELIRKSVLEWYSLFKIYSKRRILQLLLSAFNLSDIAATVENHDDIKITNSDQIELRPFNIEEELRSFLNRK